MSRRLLFSLQLRAKAKTMSSLLNPFVGYPTPTSVQPFRSPTSFWGLWSDPVASVGPVITRNWQISPWGLLDLALTSPSRFAIVLIFWLFSLSLLLSVCVCVRVCADMPDQQYIFKVLKNFRYFSYFVVTELLRVSGLPCCGSYKLSVTCKVVT